MDEISAENFLKDSSSNQVDDVALIDFCQFNLGKQHNVKIIMCVNPVIRGKKQVKIRSLSENEKQKLLEEKNLLAKQLEVSYRNCWQIQLFYNCFKCHFDERKGNIHDTLITGNMHQPSSANLKENKEGNDNLPSGHLPILVTYKKPEEKWTEQDIETVNKEITDIYKRYN